MVYVATTTTPEDDALILSAEQTLTYRGWVIVAAAFIAHVSTLGILYSQGILYAALLADAALDANRASGALFGSAAAALQ